LNSISVFRQAAAVSDIYWVVTERGNRIPVVWVRPETASSPSNGNSPTAAVDAEATETKSRIVLLHCHGNATDIGMMMGPYYEMAKMLGIEVVGTEYSGYGTSSGSPSEANTYADVKAAYDFVVGQGVPPECIVAYGQSVGSGPVSCLGSVKPLGGLVLHSPLLSGIKVIDPQPDNCCRPSCVWRMFDFYPNHRRVTSFRCPAFVMHGRRDDIIPFYHGTRLHEACPEAVRWQGYFPQRAGHNNLMEVDPRRYFGELAGFLRQVAKNAGVGMLEAPGVAVTAPLPTIPKDVADFLSM
jgi:fermentation-respiration switch protein FrsA (DUF1100 family)